MPVKKYVKRPVEVEALLYDGENLKEIEAFYGDLLYYSVPPEDSGKFSIETLEGDIVASVGDYIIKGIQGEFYPCKPDIFAKTYKEV